MKIAVCLSGQPRSIEDCVHGLRLFFRDSDQHTFDFFCHSWDYNTWKVKKDRQIGFSDVEYVDKDWLKNQIQRFNPIDYKIDSREVIYSHDVYKDIQWASLFYSAMISNHLKRQHEIKNNFRYDCVVRTRFDVIFRPGFKFTPLEILDRTLYHPHVERARFEFSYLNASDTYFYGDSWGMDIASDVFRYIERDCVNMHRLDDAEFLGPGALISKYCREYNVQNLFDRRFGTEIIFRKEMSGKNSVKDFDEILKTHLSYYE